MSYRFGPKLVAGLLVVSVVTNIVLVARLHFPQALRQIRLAFVSAPELTPADHVRGPDTAKTVMVVYTNYQCPYCAQLNHTLLALMPERKFRLAYRHFSDPDDRPRSFKAAIAAECASDQNRFWEYNDRLFESDRSFDDEDLFGIAGQLTLDVNRFRQCVESKKYAGKIASDRKEAESKKVMATPTFYINGKRYEGSRPVEEMKQLLATAADTV